MKPLITSDCVQDQSLLGGTVSKEMHLFSSESGQNRLDTNSFLGELLLIKFMVRVVVCGGVFLGSSSMQRTTAQT